MDYKTSGVDIEAGYRSVELMKEYVKETMSRKFSEDSADFQVLFHLQRSRRWKSRFCSQEQTVVEQKLNLRWL